MMKRTVAIFLAGVLMVMTACGVGESPESTQAPTPEAVSTPVPTAVPIEIPEGRLFVSIHSESGEIYSADGQQTILYYDCQTPSVSGTSAKGINAVLRQQYEEFMTGSGGEGNPISVNDYEHLSREDNAWRAQEGMDSVSYSLSRKVSVARGDETVVSFLFDEYYYTGGAHGTAIRKGITFRSDGTRLMLSDLSPDPERFGKFCVEQMLMQSRSAEFAQCAFYYGYQSILPELLRDSGWYFSDKGLVIVANPYDIAPYAFGLIEFTVGYDVLADYLHPWLLPEGEKATGTLWGALGSDSDPEPAVVVDNETDGQGQPIRFTADGPVHNVRLERVQYNEYTGGFDVLNLLWYATSLQNGETVRLLTHMPETMPNLKISYQGEGGREQAWYISRSGLDGALILLDAADFTTLPREITDELPFRYDVDHDGNMEVVNVESYLSDAMGGTALRITLTESDGSISTADTIAYWDHRLWLADGDGDGRAEIYFSGDIASNDYVLYGWHYDGESLKPMAFRDGKDSSDWLLGQIVSVDGSRQFTISSTRYVLGTYSATRPFAIGDDGFFAPVEDSYWSFDRNEFWLELSWDLNTVRNGERITLPAGSHILLTGTDGETWVEFITENDYSTGRLSIARDANGWWVGGVSESDAFVTLPYVG